MSVFRILLLISATGILSAQGIEFGVPNIATYPAFTQFSASHVIGSSHPDIMLATAGDTLTIIDRHTGGADLTMVLPMPSQPRNWAVGDVDNDGDLDIVVHCRGASGSATLSVALASSGSFTRVDYAGRTATKLMYLADFDGDGWLDIFTQDDLRRNLGGGSFAPWVTLAFATVPDDSLVGDFDGDGDLDVVGHKVGATDVSFELVVNDGTAAFASTFALTLPASDARFTSGDMNGDGIDDLVVGWDRPSVLTYNIQTFLGQPSGAFLAQPAYDILASLEFSGDIEAADLDGDGDRDLIVGCRSRNGFPSFDDGYQVFALINIGSGEFEDAPGRGFTAIVDANFEFKSFELLDDDLDGILDAVGAAKFSGSSQTELRTFELIAPSPFSPTLMLSSEGVDGFLGSAFGASSGSPVDINQPLMPGAYHCAYFRLFNNPTSPGPMGAKCIKLDISGDSGSTLTGAKHAIALAGRFTAFFTTGSLGGSLTITVSNSDGASAQISMTTPPLPQLISGSNQSACTNSLFPQPIVGRLVYADGTPVAGQGIGFSVAGPPFVPVKPLVGTNFIPGFGAYWTTTDSAGYFSVYVVAGPTPGTASLRFPNFNVDLVVQPGAGTPTLVAITPVLQGTDYGEPFPQPLKVLALNPNGSPVVGQTINFFVAFGGDLITLATPSVTTDANGYAQANVTSTLWPLPTSVPNNVGAGASIVAMANGFCSTVPFTLVVRSLNATHSASVLTIKYFHEHPNVPIIFAVDAPMPPPGFVTTPFGNIATSILSPGPGLAVLDGFGLFGSIDPGMTTSSISSWIRMYATTPALSGISVVMQVYGYDLAYSGLDGYFISNAVTLTF